MRLSVQGGVAGWFEFNRKPFQNRFGANFAVIC
jgi:hypothetical protein